jgi:hypothetical protein
MADQAYEKGCEERFERYYEELKNTCGSGASEATTRRIKWKGQEREVAEYLSRDETMASYVKAGELWEYFHDLCEYGLVPKKLREPVTCTDLLNMPVPVGLQG